MAGGMDGVRLAREDIEAYGVDELNRLRRHAWFLKASFTSDRDLRPLIRADKDTAGVLVSQCGELTNYAAVTSDATIYWQGAELDRRRDAAAAGPPFVYDVYIGVTGEETLPEVPADITPGAGYDSLDDPLIAVSGGDLRRWPVDICADFILFEDGAFGGHRSVLTIPKEAIAAALEALPAVKNEVALDVEVAFEHPDGRAMAGEDVFILEAVDGEVAPCRRIWRTLDDDGVIRLDGRFVLPLLVFARETLTIDDPTPRRYVVGGEPAARVEWPGLPSPDLAQFRRSGLYERCGHSVFWEHNAAFWERHE